MGERERAWGIISPMDATLCSPGLGLSCFRCCPPIRPPQYDHLDFRGSLRNEFSRNRADYLAGLLPHREHTGFFCSGLGFLDAMGSRVGCLFHPVNNQGRDLRDATGYRDKCKRETCPQFRAFARLEPSRRETLLNLCRGLDAFEFSSPAKNPLMRLLALGPAAAGAVAELGVESLAGLERLPILAVAPHRGWPAARLLAARGADLAASPELPVLLDELCAGLRRLAGPTPPLERGVYLHAQADEWEARFWKGEISRQKALPDELEAWRKGLDGLPA